MLSCKSHVHLHESAHFKTIFGQFLTIFKNVTKIDLTQIEHPFKKHIKQCGNTSNNITPNTPNFLIWAPILEPFASLIRLVERFCCNQFFGTSGGVTPVRASSWSPLVGFSQLVGWIQKPFYSKCKRLQSGISTFCKQRTPTIPSTKYRQGFNKTILAINPHKWIITSVL